MGADGGSGLLQGQHRQRHGHQPGVVRAGVHQPLGPACALPGDDGDLEPPDAGRHLRLAGRGLQPRTTSASATARRAASRSSRSPPSTGHAVALGGQQLDANYTGPKNPCTQIDRAVLGAGHPGPQVGPRPARRLLHGLRQRGRVLHQPPRAGATRSRRRPTRMYAPALDNDDSTYADNQAGQAYYWYVRPCRAAAQLRTGPGVHERPGPGHLHQALPRRHRADQQRPGAAARSPSPGTTTTTPTRPTRGRRPASAVRRRPSSTASRCPSTARVIDHQLVDQTTYTAPTGSTPRARWTWRVQAVDSDDNGLTWSATKQVVKASPRIVPTSPVGSAAVLGTTPFRWRRRRSRRRTTSRSPQRRHHLRERHPRGRRARATRRRPNAHRAAPGEHHVYVWRVRQIDASGNNGPVVRPAGSRSLPTTSPSLAPTADASVAPNGPVLQWPPCRGHPYTSRCAPGRHLGAAPTRWRTAARPSATSSLGPGPWTVMARDANDNADRHAPVHLRRGRADQAVQAPGDRVARGHGRRQDADRAVPRSGTWRGVETTYQWLRDGRRVYGRDRYDLHAVHRRLRQGDHRAGHRQEGRVPRRGVDQPARRHDLGRCGQQPDPPHHHRHPHGRQLPDRQPGHLVRRLATTTSVHVAA